VNTTWGYRQWASAESARGISFKGAFYALRVRGTADGGGARLEVTSETATSVTLRVDCTDPRASRVERQVRGAWTEIAAARTTTASVDPREIARFRCR